MTLTLATHELRTPAPWPCRAVVPGAVPSAKVPCALAACTILPPYLGRDETALQWLGTASEVTLETAPQPTTAPANGWLETWPTLLGDLSVVTILGNLPLDVLGFSAVRLSADNVLAVWGVERALLLADGSRLGTWCCLVELWRGRKLVRVRCWAEWQKWPSGLVITRLAAVLRNPTGEPAMVVCDPARKSAQLFGRWVELVLAEASEPAPAVSNIHEFSRMTGLNPQRHGLDRPYSEAQRAYYAAHPEDFAGLDAGNRAHLEGAMAADFTGSAISAEFWVAGWAGGDRAGYRMAERADWKPAVAHFTPRRTIGPQALEIERGLVAQFNRITVGVLAERENFPPRSAGAPPWPTNSTLLPALVPDQEQNHQPVAYRFGNTVVHYWPSQIIEFAVHTGDPALLRYARLLVDEALNCWWRSDTSLFRRAGYPFMRTQTKFIEDPSVLLLAWRYFGDHRARAAWLEYWASVRVLAQREPEHRAVEQSVVSQIIALESETLPDSVAKLVDASGREVLERMLSEPFDPGAPNATTKLADTTQFWDARLPLLTTKVGDLWGPQLQQRLDDWLEVMDAHPKKHGCGHDPTHAIGVDLWQWRRTGDGKFLARSSEALWKFCALEHRYYHYYFLSHAFGLWPHLAAALEEAGCDLEPREGAP